jgi:hypothetical protein
VLYYINLAKPKGSLFNTITSKVHREQRKAEIATINSFTKYTNNIEHYANRSIRGDAAKLAYKKPGI